MGQDVNDLKHFANLRRNKHNPRVRRDLLIADGSTYSTDGGSHKLVSEPLNAGQSPFR
jgi:hypothetical protein